MIDDITTYQEFIEEEWPEKPIEFINEMTIHALAFELPDVNTLDNEVCIITKNNRKPSLLDDLSNFGDTIINVFIYEYQKELYSWLEGPNINKIYVPIKEEDSNVAIKRKFVQDYMGNKKYWVLDDDLRGGLIAGKVRDGKTSRYKIKVSISKFCKIVELITDKEVEFAAAGYGYSEIAVAFASYKKLYIRKMIDQCFLFDGAVLNKYDIHYAGDPDLIESNDVIIDAMRKGAKVICLQYGTVDEYNRSGSKQSIASTPASHIKMIAGSYIKWGEIYKFRLKRGWHIIETKIDYKQIDKPLHWNKRKLKACKEAVVNGDPEPIVKFITNSKQTKKVF